MKLYTASEIENALTYRTFIPFLKMAFQSNIEVPNRLHYDIEKATALIMPAWNLEYFGLKIVTVHPENSKYDLPSIHADYLLKSAKTGENIAILEGKTLTSKRTAAASALAASYLARANSSKLLMIGNGALAPELIMAHASVRPISEVLIWGRNISKVNQLIASRDWQNLEVKAVQNLNEAIQWADIISCATLSETPLIHGEYIKAGQHIDLVGSYKPDMREADDLVISKSRIFVDSLHAVKESGDLAIPVANGILKSSDIQADLFELSKNDSFARQTDSEITVFKSVGLALEDLAAAIFIANFKKTK